MLRGWPEGSLSSSLSGSQGFALRMSGDQSSPLPSLFSFLSVSLSLLTSLSVTDTHTLSPFHTLHIPTRSLCLYLKKALKSLSKTVPIPSLHDGLSRTPHFCPLTLILSLWACQLPEDRGHALVTSLSPAPRTSRHVISSQEFSGGEKGGNL